ncbi:hypothetical protein L0F63_005292, partial [Massospora cicadina]
RLIQAGLHTKLVQLCANVLKVPLHSTYVAETSTTKVHNVSGSAASTSRNLNIMANQDACHQLNEHLQPYCNQVTLTATLGKVSVLAYRNMINLHKVV